MHDVDKSEELINKITILALSLAQQGHFPTAVNEIKKAIMKKYNKEAILHCLRQVETACPNNPGGYFWTVLEMETGNYDFYESVKGHEQRKGTPESAKSILQNINQRG